MRRTEAARTACMLRAMPGDEAALPSPALVAHAADIGVIDVDDTA